MTRVGGSLLTACLLLLACGGGSATPVAPLSETSATVADSHEPPSEDGDVANPDPVAASYEPTVRSVIAALGRSDAAALVALTATTTVECSPRALLGGPPSCESLALPPGSTLEMLPSGTCSHASFRPETEIADGMSQLLHSIRPLPDGLIGAYEPSGSPIGLDFLAADIVIVVATVQADGYRALHIKGDSIVALEGGCSDLPNPADVARWVDGPVGPPQ